MGEVCRQNTNLGSGSICRICPSVICNGVSACYTPIFFIHGIQLHPSSIHIDVHRIIVVVGVGMQRVVAVFLFLEEQGNSLSEGKNCGGVRNDAGMG
jgi:hypothetical protein